MNKRERLEKEIRRYTLDQLNAVVYYALNRRLEEYSIGPNYETVVFQLMQQLEMDNVTLNRFLVHLLMISPWPELRSAICEYLGLRTKNPYDALSPFDKPVVDRQSLKSKLKNLFDKPPGGTFNYHALITSGPRNSGRTHIKWLVQYVAEHEKILAVQIDMGNNSLEDMIFKLKNEMSLPNERFPDSEAQLSRQIKNFPSVLGGYLREQARNALGNDVKWCLVFDHYDLSEAGSDSQIFVDELVKYVADNPSINLWIVVLGHNNTSAFKSMGGVLVEDIIPLDKKDIENYLVQVAQSSGSNYTPVEIETKCSEIFAGLIVPPPALDKEGMRLIHERLRAFLRTNNVSIA
ncbi:hypothetical protein [Pontibacter vulgaris]|uniref:hypothetical protein n=1 Tax=Pontibacter vulgaris TaxID=2905679 RepID=UPI001FA76ADD|nr:hypothetical protein [Pontibacter vulgaris]